MNTGRPTTLRARRGTAIVAALALVMLGGALLTSAAIAVSASSHAVIAERASLEANALVSTSLADALAGWDAATDTLRVGQSRIIVPTSTEERAPQGIPSDVAMSVQRVAGGVFAITIDATVGGQLVLARRRVRLLVRRVVPLAPGASPSRPVPLDRWSRADLY